MTDSLVSENKEAYDKANREKTLEKHGNTGKNDGVYQRTDW